MVLRTAVALAALVAAGPALADPMNADAARRFVVGKLFSFTCFEGTPDIDYGSNGCPDEEAAFFLIGDGSACPE